MFQNKNVQKEQAELDSSFSSVFAPIHLMKNDLEEIKNPQKNKLEQISKTILSQENLSEKQKTSPFFNASDAPVIQKPPQEKPLETPAPVKFTRPANEEKKEGYRELGSSTFLPQQKEINLEITKEDGPNSILNKALIGFVTTFLIVFLGIGGYYFWRIKNPVQLIPPQTESDQLTTDETENQPVAVKPKPLDFSIEKPNYFSIDIVNTDKASLINQLDLYLERAKELKISAPAEFILTDKTTNNPIPFKIFAEKIGITLPTEIISLLKDTFNIFIYNDKENYRIALAIDSSDTKKLKTALLKEESRLVTSLAPILKNPDNRIFTEGNYQSNFYKNTIPIRFLNIVSPDYLTIDYAILEKKLVIGTTKNTIFSVLDYLSAPQKTVSNEKPILPTEQAQQNQSLDSKIFFAEKLNTCTKYKTTFKHLLTGENLEKEIVGIIDGKCNYIEQMPNGGKMECKYSENERTAVAQYYKDTATAKSSETSPNKDLTSGKQNLSYTINGKTVDNPLQEAMNNGICIVSGQ